MFICSRFTCLVTSMTYVFFNSFCMSVHRCFSVLWFFFKYFFINIILMSLVFAPTASLSSSRAGSAGTGSRPTSRTGSEAGSDDRDPEVYTTMQAQKRTVGGRNDTTLTYQTHRVETRTVTMPTATHTKISRIPKASPAKPKKWSVFKVKCRMVDANRLFWHAGAGNYCLSLTMRETKHQVYIFLIPQIWRTCTCHWT